MKEHFFTSHLLLLPHHAMKATTTTYILMTMSASVTKQFSSYINSSRVEGMYDNINSAFVLGRGGWQNDDYYHQ